jgi:hypothetical protein
MVVEILRDVAIALSAVLAVPVLILAACGFRLIKGKWPC